VAALIDRMLAREREQRVQDLREVSAVLARHTTLRPPEFGAAESERPQPEDDLASQPSHSAVDSSDTQRSTDPQRVPTGPETANAHTMSQGHPARTSRAIWASAALIAVAGAAFVVARPGATASSASGAAAQPAATTAPVVATAAASPAATPESPATLSPP